MSTSNAARRPAVQPAHGDLIGRFRNEWRQRDVLIFAHPTDPARVITRGVALGADAVDSSVDDPADVWTDEPRDVFARWIGSFNNVFR